MMKKKIIAGIIFLFLVGVFSVTISVDGFFFTTKFYKDALSAYNAEAGFSPVYGDTTANREIGLYEIEKEKALFIGELSEDEFIVSEMIVKDNKYASEGTVYFYNISDMFNSDVFNENNYNQTETKTDNIKWNIINNKQDVEKLQNINLFIEYSMSDGSPLFLVIFE